VVLAVIRDGITVQAPKPKMKKAEMTIVISKVKL